jgi:hypothetical protein
VAVVAAVAGARDWWRRVAAGGEKRARLQVQFVFNKFTNSLQYIVKAGIALVAAGCRGIYWLETFGRSSRTGLKRVPTGVSPGGVA